MKIGDKVKVDNPRNINHGTIGEIVDELDAPYAGGLIFQIVPDNPTMVTFWETPDNLVMVTPTLKPDIKCECGSDIAKLGTHSDWCPKHNLPTSGDDDCLPF